MSVRVLTLPGWQSSGATHWQTLWEQAQGYQRVEQHDWFTPRRGDWMARLEDVLLADPRPAVLVAHSLGCQLVASWAAHTRHASKVRAALLVAPADTEQADTPAQLIGWRPLALARLPFASVLVASTDDPYCSLRRATAFADAWGSTLVVAGACGHINGESGLGAWADGQQLLHDLLHC